MTTSKLWPQMIKDATAAGIALLTAASTAAQRSLIGASGAKRPQGRLTLASGSPVMTTTQSAKTTLYYTPFVGDTLPVYDGASMVETTFAELSVLTTDTAKNPAAIGASKVNDWFVWNDGGTLRLSHGPDWTNDTTRSAASALVVVNGIWLNSVAITNGPGASRGTYVGTTRSNGSSQLEWIVGGAASGGTAAALHVWNMYNRRTALGQATDTASHTYTSGTIRQFGASAGMQVSIVQGMAEEVGQWVFKSEVTLAAVAGAAAIVGVGFDTTTAFSWPRTRIQGPVATAYSYSAGGSGPWSPGIGRHVLSYNEQGDTANANEFNNSLSASLALAIAA